MKYLFIILFAFTLNAQTIWYVDTISTGLHDGTSWANAVNYLGDAGGNDDNGGLDWISEIQGGDTIYISGGADSIQYFALFGGQAHHIGYRGTYGDPNIVYDDTVVICPSWEAGRNGKVILSIEDDETATQGILQIVHVEGVKVTGLTIKDIRTPLVMSGETYVSGSPGSVMVSVYGADSINGLWNIFEDNEIITAGITTGIGWDGYNVRVKNNYYEEPYNEYTSGNDPFGGTGGMGTVIENNTVVLRNNYQAIPNMSADTAVHVGNGYLYDNRLRVGVDTTIYKTREDYHVGITIQINGNWNLIVTANHDSGFVGSAGWQYATYTVAADVGNTFDATHAYDATYTYATDYFKNTWIKADGDSMLVTGNSGGTITGTGWLPSTPAATSEYQFVAHAGEYPPSGTAWRMEGAHRDGMQFSSFTPHTPITDTLTTIIRNNIMVDEGVRGTGWNGLIYTSSPTAHQRWLIYNNIFVSKQEISSAGIFMYESEDSYPTQVYFGGMKFFNNTIIIKGSGSTDPADPTRYSTGQFFSFEDFDSLEVKNNLFVCDTTMAYMGKTTYNLQLEDIDYNIYAYDDYNRENFGFATGGGGYLDLDGWNALGFDVNSDTLQSSTVTFANKYGSSGADYLTTTGRDSGADLSSTFTTDILGNPRVAPFDIGALEYQSSGVIRKKARVMIVQ